MFSTYTISIRLALLSRPWKIMLFLFCSAVGLVNDIFSFLQYIQIFFSSFGLGSDAAKAVPRNKFLLTWTIRPNPFTSLRMTCGIVIVLARSKPKILAYDNQFCFYTPDSFCIYTNCIQHVVENNHNPSQRFCSGGAIIIHLINNICSTFRETIECEDLRFRFIFVFGATMHWSFCWQNYNFLFTLWFCLHSIWRKT